jgi:hypothetical protein
MPVTNNLFNRWKAVKKFPSDRQACLALGLKPQAATYWKAGRNAEADVIEKMAKEIGEEPAAWILAAAAEKTVKAEEKRTLARLARGLGYAAALLLALNGNCDAGHSIHIYNSTSINRLYIMSNITGTTET